MCEPAEATDAPEPDGSSPTRRSFLRKLGAITAGALVLPRLGPWGGEALAKSGAAVAGQLLVLNQAGALPYSMAMHVHSSFSEGPASMRAQVAEAAAHRIQAMWFTDHDWRMSAHAYRQAVHFDALTETENGVGPWVWKPRVTGTLADQEGGVRSSPVSPLDPSPTSGALYVRAQSVSGEAAYDMHADASRARQNMRANLAGQQLSIEVLPLQVGPGAWIELLLSLSYLPPTGGRPAGQYQIAYRFGPEPASTTAQGILGIVTVPVLTGQWSSVVIDPTTDAGALWPDVDPRDNSSADLWLGARSVDGAVAEGCFDYLRFTRSQVDGDAPLELQNELVSAYRTLYPQVVVNRGVEVSKYADHINWLGGDQHLYQYPGTGLKGSGPSDFNTTACDLIHSYGGLASINHPFGTSTGKASAIDAQEGVTALTAGDLIAGGAYHADILEVGYRKRGNATLEAHLQLWDVMSQNGLWLTANGVSDDHAGTVGVWAKMQNHFLTYAWALSTSEADLLAALAAGRAYCGELGTFKGALDLWVEGNPMGSISVRPDLSQRTLTVTATDIPGDSIVELVQGPVDYAGSTTSRAAIVQTVAATAISGGFFDTVVDTSSDTFLRVNVMASSGKRIAFCNPVYLLRAPPPTGIPAARQAPDTPA